MKFKLLSILTLTIVNMAPGQDVYSGQSTPWAAFQRGIRQDEKVTVQVLRRKLDVPTALGGSVSSSIAETFGGVHYQIVVKDTKGRVLENYGWNGENNGTVFSEPNERISVDYGSEPAFEATVSYDEFRQTLSEWKSDANNRKYSLTNAGVGGGLTQPGYNGETRSDESQKMTMMVLEENCQRMANDFAIKLAENGSCSVTREFSYPGAIVAENIAGAVVKSAMTTTIEENGNDVIRPSAEFKPSPEVQPTDSGILNKDVLHSLADLLETGEEIVEVREDMREERHERKAREQAERERKAAEEERLLQQQLDAQRRKAQSEQKKSKSSGAEVARRPTPTTQQNRPAGTNPATETGTEPTDTGSQTSTTPPAQTTVRIDFTPLDNCTSILNSSRNLIGSLAASMVEVAMSNGEKAYSKLKSQIASLPEGDQKKQLEQTLEAKYAAFKAAKSYYE